MPSFYKGAAIGTYWHQNNARQHGFVAHSPTLSPTLSLMQRHIVLGSVSSPYISLTSSYAVAEDYAVLLSRIRPSATNPAYVYEVVLDDPLPSGLDVFDPVVFVASNGIGNPLSLPTYRHDGDTAYLSYVANPAAGLSVANQNVRVPPPTSGIVKRPAHTMELETIVRAMRDAEILAIGNIPAANVVNRWSVN